MLLVLCGAHAMIALPLLVYVLLCASKASIMMISLMSVWPIVGTELIVGGVA